VGGQRHHRDTAGRLVGLELPGRFPAIDDRKTHIHQDQVRRVGPRFLEPLRPVHRDGDLVAALDEPPREHVAVHLLVFNEQNVRHVE